jgi:hypothetical protein
MLSFAGYCIGLAAWCGLSWALDMPALVVGVFTLIFVALAGIREILG